MGNRTHSHVVVAVHHRLLNHDWRYGERLSIIVEIAILQRLVAREKVVQHGKNIIRVVVITAIRRVVVAAVVIVHHALLLAAATIVVVAQ